MAVYNHNDNPVNRDRILLSRDLAGSVATPQHSNANFQNGSRRKGPGSPWLLLAGTGPPPPSEKWPDPAVVVKLTSPASNVRGRSSTISMVLPFASSASGPRVSRTPARPAAAPAAPPMPAPIPARPAA